ncbi:hypothetical protein [Kitasatospora sp. NPDC058190]|uniref:hypothetical protein n=1 Tax=Kitasatospora sp. NPDC058190 TaxID=3346371 RepID=UPI0036DC7DC1
MHPLITELDLDGDPKLLHERRGTTFIKVGDTALKITDGLMAGREGQVLSALGADHYLAHGRYGDGTWLTMRWIDGTSLWDVLEPAHRGDDTPTTRRSRSAGQAHQVEWLRADRDSVLPARRSRPATARCDAVRRAEQG